MKNLNLKGLLSLGTLTVFFAASSFGQTKTNESPAQEKTVAEIFEEMDINKDDKLSQEELKEPLKKDFKLMDHNEDGFISREELTKSLQKEGKLPSKEQ